MIVMKFGGTSVANYEAITRTISIVRGKLGQKPVVVVSALSKVTDLLYRISDCAAAGDAAGADANIDALKSRHLDLANELLAGAGTCAEACAKIEEICESLRRFVGAVCALGELTDRSKAKIISRGEWLSSTRELPRISLMHAG